MRAALWPGLALALALAGCSGPPAITGCEPGGDLVPVCEFVNPEDLAPLPGDGWLLVSQFPQLGSEAPEAGSLVAFRPADGALRPLYPVSSAEPASADGTDPACPGPPDPARFAPHGIDLSRDGRHVWVVNHGGREAIERFTLDPATPALRWSGCVVLPEGDQANDVAALPGGAFVATRMLPAEPGLLDLASVLLGRVTGHVLHWSPDGGWKVVPGSEASAPNGIAASSDGSTLFVAEWGGDRVVRIGLDGSGRSDAALPHHPDNLTWRDDGTLLVTGQLGAIAQLVACGEIAEGTCAIGFSVVAIDPASLGTTVLLEHDPATITGAASVALEHDGVLWIGTFAGDRIVRRGAPW